MSKPIRSISIELASIPHSPSLFLPCFGRPTNFSKFPHSQTDTSPTPATVTPRRPTGPFPNPPRTTIRSQSAAGDFKLIYRFSFVSRVGLSSPNVAKKKETAREKE
ncbi:hypothetical protein GWI33_010783 [Rhynchophorus ferrugineus]|uniref:Uncharacterized protein n=1 Tax=Rhynchophorus ferrugineus TaxID=354439 RepID=A0A834IQC8_RHYFE|nr:hypothetical protein GWI33_010783 [Rhynchophorus ferrugineus]